MCGGHSELLLDLIDGENSLSVNERLNEYQTALKFPWQSGLLHNIY